MVTISLCMIVKNEENNLEKCLQSVKGIPDEIIIVDTGSTDRTKEIALKWTSHVLDFEWIDDFAAARNYAFGCATQEYLFWLDADDILLPEEQKKILELKQNLDESIDAVSMVYHTLLDKYDNVITSTHRLRLLKKNKGFKWSGMVHEDVNTSEIYRCYNSDIIVTHTKGISPTKRNLEIYEKAEREETKFTSQDYFNYARELQVNKMYEKAIKYHNLFLESKNIPKGLRVFTYHNLACCYFQVGKLEKELELTLESFKYDIPQPVFCCRMGENFVKKKQYEQAIFWYILAIENGKLNQNNHIEQFIYKTWLPHKQLGLCYYKVGNYMGSYEQNKEVLKYMPDDKETLNNVSVLKGILHEQGAILPDDDVYDVN
ncbi:glycosyltransferase family 2 protein [Bacillus thuringiensis]|nr:glycosyltransferase family 2 protein [Bacillus thuringiensis]MED2758226.1 glycosyltransferase family 2 protein [Bacillus thuringiensis]MED2761923.1 glycosyltransferase family 2 protein [Bacillus thuringiensis]MED2768739.1 glycosyltransferase family 2 protein [Bacillus thuringiensis]MED2772816.1 glycosyltransferase family 2 protein [Bacillus thuringiensis]